MSTVRLCFAYSEMPLLPAGAFSFVPAILSSISATFSKGKDEITEPKTRESVRTVIIPEFLAEELKEYMASMYKLPADERIFAVVPGFTNPAATVKQQIKQNVILTPQVKSFDKISVSTT